MRVGVGRGRTFCKHLEWWVQGLKDRIDMILNITDVARLGQTFDINSESVAKSY